MPPPDRRVGWIESAKVFEELGFVLRRDNEDNVAYTKLGVVFPVTLPKVESIDLYVIRCNCRTAGISEEEFFRRILKNRANQGR